MNQGIYEELVTQLVNNKLSKLEQEDFHIQKSRIDKAEASTLLSKHLAHSIKAALSTIRGEHQLDEQIEIANRIILFLKDVSVLYHGLPQSISSFRYLKTVKSVWMLQFFPPYWFLLTLHQQNTKQGLRLLLPWS